MHVLAGAIGGRRACRQKIPGQRLPSRRFPFVDKYLRTVRQAASDPPPSTASQSCRDLSNCREVSVDNAVNAITDSSHTNFTASRHGTFRDPEPALRCSGAMWQGVHRPLFGVRSQRKAPRSSVARWDFPRSKRRTCTALLDLVVTQQETRKDRRPRCRRPATSASTTGRRAPKRDTRSHRKVPRSQQAGQRPARRNIGWHLMPMY